MPPTMHSCLNNLGALWQRVERPRLQARLGTTKSRAPSGVEAISSGGLDLGEALVVHGARGLAAVLHGTSGTAGCRCILLPPQVEVAVASAGSVSSTSAARSSSGNGGGSALIDRTSTVAARRRSIARRWRGTVVHRALGARPDDSAGHAQQRTHCARRRSRLTYDTLEDPGVVAQVDEGQLLAVLTAPLSTQPHTVMTSPTSTSIAAQLAAVVAPHAAGLPAVLNAARRPARRFVVTRRRRSAPSAYSAVVWVLVPRSSRLRWASHGLSAGDQRCCTESPAVCSRVVPVQPCALVTVTGCELVLAHDHDRNLEHRCVSADLQLGSHAPAAEAYGPPISAIRGAHARWLPRTACDLAAGHVHDEGIDQRLRRRQTRPPRRQASRMRSTPRANPIPSVGGPPRSAARPS